jgi:DNA-binding XRE family transcriptional regulator
MQIYTIKSTLPNRVLKNRKLGHFCNMSVDEFEPDYLWIAQRLKQLRKEKGFNNYEHFAYELGMSRSAYWRIEKGANFEIRTLLRMCKLLGITLHDFFTLTPDKASDV